MAKTTKTTVTPTKTASKTAKKTATAVAAPVEVVAPIEVAAPVVTTEEVSAGPTIFDQFSGFQHGELAEFCGDFIDV